MTADKNEKGEFAIYDNGKIIGYEPVTFIDGARVTAKMAPLIQRMKADALIAGVTLTLVSGLRTWSEQLWLRKQNAPVEKRNDNTFLLTADSSFFAPRTGKPGFSNHQDGKAYDFNTTGNPRAYAWLVNNAYKYGFIRTVASERWHWEYIPDNINPFVVPMDDPTWDGMATDLAKLAAEVQAGRIKRIITDNAAPISIVAIALMFFFLLVIKKK